MWRLWLAIALLTPSVAAAQAGRFTASTPAQTSAGSAANDLRVTVSFDPLQLFGRQPVEVDIKAVKPTASDRQITVRFYADRGFDGTPDRYDLAYERDAELPAGAAQLSIEMLIPKLHSWGMVRWQVWVDGRLDPDLSGGAALQSGGAQGPVSILAPGPQQAIGSPTLGRLLAFGSPRGTLNGVIEMSYAPLPSDWRGLESYHAVQLSADELQAQASKNPEGVAALRRWVSLGGQLLIENARDDFRKLDKVDEFLGPNSRVFDRQLARDQQPEAPPDKEDDEPPVEVTPPPFPDSPAWRWAEVLLPGADDDEDDSNATDRSGGGRRVRSAMEGWFLERPVGFGMVTVFPEAIEQIPDERSGGGLAKRFSTYSDRWLQRAVVSYLAGWDWTQRHGLAPDRGNDEFSNWLVPGVGAAPVDAFRLLVTLFVLLVGPASFFVLRAYHRTQLMALTAPLAAAVFTLCLFAYATFSDGVGLRVRVRSLTLLDQQRGEAVSWSRQSYYAGLAPADGLVFPEGSAVYPIMASWQASAFSDAKPYMREMIVEEDAERYSRGWLSSRQTSQLLALDSRKTNAGLRLGGTDDKPTVTNELGATIDRLFVLDRDANWWSVRGVPNGETLPLNADDRAGIVAAARRAFLDAAPAYPPGIDGSTHRTSINPFARRRSRNRYGRGGGASLEDGQLERLLIQIEGRSDGLTTPLRPGTYIAITDSTVAAPLGSADARELGSFHVTLGVWGEDAP